MCALMRIALRAMISVLMRVHRVDSPRFCASPVITLKPASGYHLQMAIEDVVDITLQLVSNC